MANHPDFKASLSVDAWLSGGGELGRLIRRKDWSCTPLGPIESWPQSLKTTLGILLHSRYPMFVFWGPQLVKIYNDAYRPITGHKHPWALGRPGYEVWPEIWNDIKPLVDRALAGDPTWSDDLLLFMERNGFPEEVYFTFSYSPVSDESGGVGGMFCACTETTGQVLGERRLRTLRDLAAAPADARTVADACVLSARALETNAMDVPYALVYLADIDGRFRLRSQTGVKPGDPVAPLEIDSADAPGPWPVARVVADRAPEHMFGLGDWFTSLPAGPWPEPPTSAIVLPLVDRGLERGVGALVLGLSSRRLFDDEYREWCELIAAQVSTSITNARAAEEERKRAEALAEIDRAKTAFFSNVSHEFRTPLTLLIGPFEDALADPSRALRGEALDTAHRNALRLLKLVNSLLDFSRLEAGRAAAQYEPVDLAALTTDLTSLFRAAVEKAGLVFSVDCPPLAEPVYVDRDMWEKVVLNLLSNAFKHTFEGGIAVTLREADGRAELSVRDTGIGVAAVDLPHLFERFHRVRGARGRTHEGTGIGLALVQELVKLHGGRIHVESAPGDGSTFTVSLPFGSAHLPRAHVQSDRALTPSLAAARAYAEEALRWLPQEIHSRDRADERQLTGSPGDTSRSPAPGARILLADDNADMRDYVRRLLEPHWRVEAVADGEAALAAIRRDPPDLVLSDVMMPAIDGYELLRRLRASEHRGVPVILLSARAGEEARVEGMTAGADDYLVKPFGARELIARVGAAMELSRVRKEGQEQLAAVNRDLRNRVAELETLLNVIPVGIGIALDSECRTIQANPSFAATLGVPATANTSLTAPAGERPTTFRVLGVDGQEIAPENLPMQVAAREGRAVLDIEFDVVHSDGRVVRLLEYAAPLFDENGEPRGAIGAFVDVTERRQAEARNQFLVRFDDAVRVLADPRAIMALASELLGAQLGVSRCSYADVDPDGEHVTIPHEYTDGGTYRPLVGRWPLSAFPERVAGELRRGAGLVVRNVAREIPEASAAFAAFGVSATICATEVRGTRLSAMMAVHSAEPRNWRADEIELVQLCAARCWESIERARALRALADSESRFRTMADNAPVMVWVTEPDGRCSYLSKTWYEFTGQTPETGLGLGWLDAVHPDDRARGEARLLQIREGREAFRVDYRLRRHDGEYRWVIDSAAPRIGPHGELQGFIGSVIDITDQKQLEASLRQTNRLKDEFLATLSHEMRTPLNAVLGWTHMIRTGTLREDVHARAFESIERNARAQAQLVDDLLDVSRAISGKLQLHRESINLNDIVALAIETIHPTAVNKGVKLQFDAYPHDPAIVTGDADRLRQVAWNLLSNAVKFTPPGGTVEVQLKRAGAGAEIVVRDTGQGIDADFLPFVFDRFRQADGTTTRRHGGLGLGLAIVRHLTEAHGGTVSAASGGPGKGATFTVRLPVATPHAPATAATRGRRPEPAAVLNGSRILVVDDEMDARELLLAMLERYGAEVSVAASAGDALHQLQRGSFDILLADIGMPDQDGFALIRAIRSLPGPERNLPAVAVTAYASRRESALALEAGYGWHLPKPVQPELLLATVCTAIESGTAAARGDSTTGRPARSRTVRKSRSRTEPRRKKNAS